MSAVNSNAAERDAEALRRAQRAHEPSMEEILASIRSIIAEERELSRPAGWKPPPPAAPAVAPPPAPPGNTQPAPATSAADEEPLTSPETEEQVLAAFATLSAGLRARSAELAEAMVRELIRPMLKAWLDERLPAIVERLVRAELDRISRSLR